MCRRGSSSGFVHATLKSIFLRNLVQCTWPLAALCYGHRKHRLDFGGRPVSDNLCAATKLHDEVIVGWGSPSLSKIPFLSQKHNSPSEFPQPRQVASQCRTTNTYRGEKKGWQILLSYSQAEKLSRARKKYLTTTYQPFFSALYYIQERSEIYVTW